VSGVPTVLALPSGVWLAQHWGYLPVFLLSAAIPVASIATVPFLPARTRDARITIGVAARLRAIGVRRPAVVFAASAAGAGVLATYLPLATRQLPGWIAPAALFGQTIMATAVKPVAGRLGDRRRHTELVLPGILLSALGMLGVSLTREPVAVLVGSIVFGAGFGVLQNSTLTIMYERSDTGAYPAVAAIWNAAYDTGMAVGAFVVGMLVASTGYSTAFAVTAAVMALAAAAAPRPKRWRRRRAAHPLTTDTALTPIR
jgi:predicted MFS family arabinose efflux permease